MTETKLSLRPAAIAVRTFQAVETRDGKTIHLALYRKRIGTVARPELFLVRASSTAARTKGNSGIACGREDLAAAMTAVARDTRPARCHFPGAPRAAAYAMVAPDRVRRMVLA